MSSDREQILIRTKMNRPQLPADIIARPRLLERLDKTWGRRVTLISAPAGYGKSTLAVQWLEGCPSKIAWISLDPDDRNPDRFSRYLVASIQAALPGCLPRSTALLNAVSPPAWSYFSEVVVSELGELDQALVLVFDDFQSIDSGSIGKLVSSMVEHLPERLGLLLLSRADPSLPLGRWRAKGWLTEIRARDLRFETEEIHAFFADASSIGLSDADLSMLERKTEGWVAGLQFIKLSIRQSDDPRKSVERFSGSNRLIVDFLVDEVLAVQPPEVRELMAATATLKRFCAPLCERLLSESTVRPSAADLLAHIERENLFLVALDADHRWFRYHNLFGQLLAHHLPGAASQEYRRGIARKAAEWFAGQGLVKEALQLWIEAGDLDSAANYLGSQLHGILEEDYSLSVLRRLLALFPPGAEQGRLPLLVAHAYTAIVFFDLPRLASLLEEADVWCGYDPDTGKARSEDFRADLHAQRAFLHAWRGEPEKAVMHAERALKLISDDDIGKARFTASMYKAAGLYLTDRYGECVSFLREAIHQEDLHGRKGSGALRIALGHLNLMANDLASANMVAQQAIVALQTGQTARYFFGETYYLFGVLALERDLLGKAADCFERLVDLRYLFIAWAFQDALIGLALVAERRGDREALERWTHEARVWAVEIRNKDCLRASESFERRLYARAGSAVPTIPAPVPIHDAVNIRLEVPSITHAEILVTHPHAEIRRDALPYIEEAIAVMERSFNARQVLRLLVLRAVALAEAGRREEAFDGLDRAITMAEPQGSIRPFLGGGERTAALLAELASRRGRSGFLDRVLRAVNKGTAPVARTNPEAGDGSDPGSPDEALTLRELETLELLAGRLTNKEIATRLKITPGAVNKRLLSIYAKLDVHGRREAVAEAVKRGLLKQSPV